MAQKNKVAANALASFAGSSLSTSYQAVNSGLSYPCYLIRLVNLTNKDVTISYNGSTDHDVVKNGETVEIYSQSNALPSSETALFGKGMIVYVKAASSGTGTFYLSTYYQQS